VLTGLEAPRHGDLAKAACPRSPVLKLLATADRVEAGCLHRGRLPPRQALVRQLRSRRRWSGRERHEVGKKGGGGGSMVDWWCTVWIWERLASLF
jgi:hypothetical protein